MAGPRGILFDKDGTLFDHDATWAGWVADLLHRLAEGDGDQAARLGAAVDFDFEARAFHTHGLAVQGTLDEIADALARHLPVWAPAHLRDHLYVAAEDVVPVGAVPLAPFLAGLQARGLALGVATNDGYAPAMAHFERTGIAHFFDFVAGADSGHGAKPHPGMCLAFAEALALPPDACVMVGDSPLDMAAGRRAGMLTVAIARTPAEHATLAPLADTVVASIAELPAWLDRIAG